MDDGTLPEFATHIASDSDEESSLYHRYLISRGLKTIFFPHFSGKADSSQLILNELASALPLFKHSQIKTPPYNISLYVLLKLRLSASKFFYEMVTRWLLPGKRLNVTLSYAIDFTVPALNNDCFTFCELVVRVNDHEELGQIIRNLPVLETEIKLGVQSSYYANRILEIKGVAYDEKLAIIQAFIAHLLQRFPQTLDHDIFNEMQQFLVVCKDEFKRTRESRHLSRIIIAHYHFRRELKKLLKQQQERRHLFIKVFRAKLRSEQIERPVVGISIGINFLKDKEVFDNRHILRAVQNHVPNSQIVEGSYYSNSRHAEDINLLYLEIEKIDGSEFTPQELGRLKNDLADDLKESIERLMHPIFMPRNHEEIMRNILSLADQLKFLNDLPQVFITFDEQTHTHLYFTIIFVQVLKKGSLSVAEQFKKIDTFLDYIHDFCKTVGFLRKKYPKEATVFRVRLPKEMFLRNDHSIDLYKARQIVSSELSRIVGEIRDFNGGMISKQNEQLSNLRAILLEGGISNDFLLENFFYSLAPAALRSVHDPQVLKNLFIMMIQSLEAGLQPGERDSLKIQRDLETIYIMISTDDPSIKDKLDKALLPLNIPSTELGSVLVNAYDTTCIGYIYYSNDPYKQEHFCQTFQQHFEAPLLK